MKHLIVIFSLCLTSITMAQQSIDIPHNYNNQFIYNPAATSLWNDTDISGFYNNSFNNVDEAPSNFMIGLQYPIDGQNASAGGYIISESASLLTQTTLGGTFAYKLRGIGNGYISGGIGLNLSMFNFDGNDAIVTNLSDPNLGDDNSGMGINVQAGIVYSSAEELSGRNRSPLVFQAGLGAARLNQGVNIKSIYTYEEEMVLSGFINFILSQGREFVFKSYFESQYERHGLLNLNLGGRAIINSTFMGGASIDNDFNLGIQFGVLLAPKGSESVSTLAVNFNLPMGDIVTYTNPGVGLSFHHQIKTASGW